MQTTVISFNDEGVRHLRGALAIVKSAAAAGSRPQLGVLRIDGGKAVATDGHRIAVFPCDPTDRPRSIPLFDLRASATNVTAAFDDERGQILVTQTDRNGRSAMVDQVLPAPPDTPAYPDWRRVDPRQGEGTLPSVAVNTLLIAAVQKALGAKAARILPHDTRDDAYFVGFVGFEDFRFAVMGWGDKK